MASALVGIHSLVMTAPKDNAISYPEKDVPTPGIMDHKVHDNSDFPIEGPGTDAGRVPPAVADVKNAISEGEGSTDG